MPFQLERFNGMWKMTRGDEDFKKMVSMYLKLPLHRPPGETEKNRNKIQTGHTVTYLRFQPSRDRTLL